MITIDLNIKKYIDTTVGVALDAREARWNKKIDESVNKAVTEAEDRFSVRTERYMRELRDGFKEDIKMGFEAADLHMRVIARETTREVIREEVPGIVRKELMMFLAPSH
ncbi:MAG: hypothetical protein WCQ60_03570 [bacterium]